MNSFDKKALKFLKSCLKLARQAQAGQVRIQEVATLSGIPAKECIDLALHFHKKNDGPYCGIYCMVFDCSAFHVISISALEKTIAQYEKSAKTDTIQRWTLIAAIVAAVGTVVSLWALWYLRTQTNISGQDAVEKKAIHWELRVSDQGASLSIAKPADHIHLDVATLYAPQAVLPGKIILRQEPTELPTDLIGSLLMKQCKNNFLGPKNTLLTYWEQDFPVIIESDYAVNEVPCTDKSLYYLTYSMGFHVRDDIPGGWFKFIRLRFKQKLQTNIITRDYLERLWNANALLKPSAPI
jgi:hypothetical protein